MIKMSIIENKTSSIILFIFIFIIIILMGQLILTDQIEGGLNYEIKCNQTYGNNSWVYQSSRCEGGLPIIGRIGHCWKCVPITLQSKQQIKRGGLIYGN